MYKWVHNMRAACVDYCAWGKALTGIFAAAADTMAPILFDEKLPVVSMYSTVSSRNAVIAAIWRHTCASTKSCSE